MVCLNVIFINTLNKLTKHDEPTRISQTKSDHQVGSFLFNRKLRDFLLNKNTDFIPVQDFRLCRNAHGKTKRYCLDRRLRRAAKPLCSIIGNCVISYIPQKEASTYTYKQNFFAKTIDIFLQLW